MVEKCGVILEVEILMRTEFLYSQVSKARIEALVHTVSPHIPELLRECLVWALFHSDFRFLKYMFSVHGTIFIGTNCPLCNNSKLSQNKKENIRDESKEEDCASCCSSDIEIIEAPSSEEEEEVS